MTLKRTSIPAEGDWSCGWATITGGCSKDEMIPAVLLDGFRSTSVAVTLTAFVTTMGKADLMTTTTVALLRLANFPSPHPTAPFLIAQNPWLGVTDRISALGDSLLVNKTLTAAAGPRLLTEIV